MDLIKRSLIMGLIQHHLCFIVFVSSMSHTLPALKRISYKGHDSLGVILEWVSHCPYILKIDHLGSDAENILQAEIRRPVGRLFVCYRQEMIRG